MRVGWVRVWQRFNKHHHVLGAQTCFLLCSALRAHVQPSVFLPRASILSPLSGILKANTRDLLPHPPRGPGGPGSSNGVFVSPLNPAPGTQ